MTGMGARPARGPAARMPAAQLLDALPPVRVEPDALQRIRDELARTGTRNAVLDDDPTGTQTVAGVPVLTGWDESDLRWALDAGPGSFFVLTNTRSLDAATARTLNEQVAERLRRAAAAAGDPPVRVVSRSDSTLRGHYPLETDVHEAAARAAGRPYDGVLLTPAYLAAGRLTVGDVHWTRDGDDVVPVGETEYAKDATFGYRSSDLHDWVSEKSGDRWSPQDVVSLDLTTIRSGGPDAVAALLSTVRDGRPVIVNAAAEEDFEVVVLGMLAAERDGQRFLHRNGPSLVRILSGLEPQPPLRGAQIYPQGPREGHGLVVVGSHVGNTSRQVERLLELPGLVHVELDVPALLASTDVTAFVHALAEPVASALDSSEVLVTTSRQLVIGADADQSLTIAGRVSRALVDVVALVRDARPLRFVVAKGGITSSDVATRGLGLRRAEIAGQLFPGIVSVWVSDDERDPGLPFVVFPGNVGDVTALADAVRHMRGEQ